MQFFYTLMFFQILLTFINILQLSIFMLEAWSQRCFEENLGSFLPDIWYEFATN
jgi:hypothetical protein